MDTHRLKYFLRIAEERSITRAAGLLGIAQPALSRQLQLLEEDLGVALFTRTRRGVELTEAGERLRASTAGPLRQLELAVQYAGTPLARLDRTLRLGLPESTVGLLAAPLLGSLAAVFPEATFSVTAGTTEELVEGMLKGAVDIALINPVPDDRVFYRELLAEEFFVIGGPESGLEATRAVAFGDVVALPLVVPRSSAGVGLALQNAALRAKVQFSHRMTTDSLSVMKNVIEAGIAYGVLPLSACRREINDGRLRFAPVGDAALSQRLGVAATSQLDLPRELSVKIGDTVREEVAALIGSGSWQAELTSTSPWDPARG
ncbi:LysR family transcriptional regulator [Mycobacterium sp. E802]|uniref:LysR family transcriptional regulator n=1 Tax=Mycobacterium sp. E802 TaxID=1834152 RepID=UPI0007FF59D9|nr:LysR family transcriptional regulator [Mycobacterium sp. E802]OBG87027.1 LysR family transcriptional regulator [Mycobacterium sp. E802]